LGNDALINEANVIFLYFFLKSVISWWDVT